MGVADRRCPIKGVVIFMRSSCLGVKAVSKTLECYYIASLFSTILILDAIGSSISLILSLYEAFKS